MYAHLSRKRDSPPVDVYHAVGEVVPILTDHTDTFRGWMRLARRMIGAQLWVLANDACLTRY